jgi:hypothetical protein
VLAAVLAPLLTIVLTSARDGLNLISDVLVYLMAVIVVALVGGFVPTVLLAIASSLLLNFYFVPPIHKFTIAEANNALALGVFVVVALLVSSVVDRAARRTRQAARASAESALLGTTAGNVLAGQRAVEAVLDRVREAFGMDSVTLLERGADTATGKATAWTVVAYSGPVAVTAPDEADVEVPVGKGLRLALVGRTLTAADHRVLGAFATYAAPQVRLGDLVVDLTAKRVTRPDGSSIRLTPTEWHLLEFLLRHPGKLLSQRQLLAEVWGPGYTEATGNLRLYMTQLRRKLEPDPARPRWLHTEPGMATGTSRTRSQTRQHHRRRHRMQEACPQGASGSRGRR